MQHSSGLQLCIFVYRVVITRSGKILLWTYYKQILRRNISNMMIENVLDGKKTPQYYRSLVKVCNSQTNEIMNRHIIKETLFQ